VGGDRQFVIPDVETHLLKSHYIDQVYQIKVMQPILTKGEAERFPVVYLTDANMSFDFAKGISHCLQAAGQVKRYILVGIGYPGENPFAGDILRIRDLTPDRRAEVKEWPCSSPIETVVGIEPGQKRCHGAHDFLRFIRDQLTAFIEDRYPASPIDRGYFGHSLGGTFGLHALFSDWNVFSRYIISSPALSWEGDDHGIDPIAEFIASSARLEAKLFMSVGGEEEFSSNPKSQLVSSFFRLAGLLHRARLPGLEFTSRVYPGETHLSVYPIAFSHGVQFAYGPAERAPLARR
jgi:uncharacterized protein